MHARSGSLEVAPDRLDDAIARFEQELVPRYREQSGYKGFTMLVDRESGKVHGLSFWDSEADMTGVTAGRDLRPCPTRPTRS